MWQYSEVWIFALCACAAIGGVLTFDNRIVNGSLALPGEFPYMVSLRRASSGRHSCGGSLLNRVWVLTAAHCVVKAEPQQINVQYGSNELDRNSTNVANIAKIYVHEGYNSSNQFIHDIALLRLDKAVKVESDFIGVRLPEYNANTANETPVILIGWGLNATGGVVQKHLQKVDLDVFSDEECSRRHGVTMHPTNLCAGVPEGGKGQCSGDSGGPLILKDTQVGIVSWSRKPCTIPPYPGVFTEVSAYVGWILETILDAEDEEDFGDSSEGFDGIMTGNLIMVSLRLTNNKRHFCAGTILNTQWILTAAHCFTFIKSPEQVVVQHGTNDLYPKEPKYVEVKEINIHEGYNPTVAVHDIALIKLKNPLNLKGNTQRVVLIQDSLTDIENSVVELIGWGLNETYGSLSPHLQKVSLTTLSLDKCRSQIQSVVHKTNICAGAVNKGQCSGDSGGPLMLGNKQLALVSWSLKPCGSQPGVFTNIMPYIKWIQEYIE